MTGLNTISYQFDEFELDLARRRLLRDGVPVMLKPKAFDMLAVLVENNGKLLTKDDLFRLVWGDQFVEETNLTVSISAIRKALGERASEPRYITNVSGRGYYFNADLRDKRDRGEMVEKADRPVTEFDTESENETLDDERSSAKENAARHFHVKPSTAILIGSVAALLIVSLAAVSYLLFSRRGDGSGELQALSVRRMTTSGRADRAGISPDGKWFVYAQQEPDGKQSLWLSQTEGGGQIQLRPPIDKVLVCSQFSPDQNRIYFVQFETDRSTTGTLFRMPVIGGIAEKVMDGVPNRITFSPDGKQFAFMRADAANNRTLLVAASVDGSTEHDIASITKERGSFTSAISWSPNGAFIAAAIANTDKESTATDIYAVNVADGSMKPFTKQKWYSVRSLAWTKGSDGLIAAVSEGPADLEKQIWQIPFPDGEPRKLLADSNSYSSLELSSDNSVILAVQTQTISNIWVAPANDLSAAKQVTFDMLGRQTGWNGLDWTEDSHIVYSGRNGKNDTIWEMNIDGEGQRQIIPENGQSDYVSLPDDGRFVVFASSRAGGSDIWRANRDGSELKQLTTGGDGENPHVSPDGKWVVYSSTHNAGGRLWRVSTDGGEPVRLTDVPSDWARFSPDSQLIACSYEAGGKVRLGIVSIDGGEPQKVFDVPATANFRLGARWTPDGRAVTYRDWRNGIWRQDIAGGEPTRLEGLPAEKLFSYAWSRDGRWFAFSRGTAINDVVLLSSLK